MKYSLIIMLLSMTIVSAKKSYTQTTRISLDLNRVSVENVLQEIEKNSEFYFLYSHKLVDVNREVSLSCDNQPINDILSDLFSSSNVDFIVIDNQIILSPKEAITKTKSLLQSITITGKVTDENGEPLPGLNIIVKGTIKGTVTNLKGEYTIEVEDASKVLVFSYVGYKSKEITVGNQTVIDVIMEPEEFGIDEVVVIGYGSISAKEVSSSIVQIRQEDFIQGSVNNAMELIAGKVAGLNVGTTAPADPNSEASLQIRGAGSLFAGTEPLIVINDIPGGNLKSISPEDIKSVTILKDAAAAAIYGTRGANGVILVSTTTGPSAKEEFSVKYDSWFGVKLLKNVPHMLSADEYRLHERGADFGGNTDWHRVFMRDYSFDNNQYISFNKSSQHGYSNASLNYRKNDGMNIGNNREELGGRLDYMQKTLNDYVEFSVNTNIRKVKSDLSGLDGGIDEGTITKNPTTPIYNEDGSWYYEPSHGFTSPNPVQLIEERTKVADRLYLLGSAGMKVHILTRDDQALNTSIRGVYEYNTLHLAEYVPSTYTLASKTYAGSAQLQDEFFNNRTFEWLTNYSLYHENHSIRVLLGYTYQDFTYSVHGMDNFDFTFDEFLWNDIGSGSYLKEGLAGMGSNKNLSKVIGVFGRVNYNWRDFIMASASLRHEGSSKFGENNKWGYFPAASIAWEMSNMSFIKNSVNFIDMLKLRFSYGITGRQDFGPYKSLTTYSTSRSWWGREFYYLMDGQWVPGFEPTINPNPNLRWEKNIVSNLGIDFAFLANRLYGSVDLFNRLSEDLLYYYTAPQPPMVYRSILVNVGTIRNRGLEINLGGTVFESSNLKWSANLISSFGKTILKYLSNDLYQNTYIDMYPLPVVGSRDYFFRYTEGSEIGQFWGYRHAGFTDDGLFMIYDRNGEAVIKGNESPEDKTFIGSGVPLANLSLGNTLKYRKFELSILLRSALGFEVFNYEDYVMGYQGNVVPNVLHKAYEPERIDIVGDPQILTSYHVQKGDYLKIENISVGYSTGIRGNFINNLRIYLAASNVATFTSYPGSADPSFINVNGLTPGLAASTTYPNAVTISLGLNVNF
jgi:TonB-linked SusC/RagA family outer membrane protein